MADLDLEQIIDDRQARDRMAARVDVLAKVKALALLPDDVHATTEMVASFFEVAPETIKSVVKNNRAELETDGYRVVDGEELRSVKDLSQISSRTPSLALFPRRAVLRVAMLLRDSVIAWQVRSQLLDAERAQRQSGATLVDFSSTEAAISTVEAMLGFLRQQQQMELVAAGERAELEQARPKAAFVEAFVDPTRDATQMRVFAIQLGYGEHQMRGWLADMKVIYRRHAGQRWSNSQNQWVEEYEWTPYSGYRDWFVVRDQPSAPRLHNDQMRTTMYVSPIGKQKIRELITRTGGPAAA